MKKRCFTLLLLLLCFAWLTAQSTNPWKAVPESSFAKNDMDRRIVPDRYETFALDLAGMNDILKKAPMRFSQAAKTTTPVLSVPVPGGRFMDFRFVEAPVMHPDLGAKFPEIKTYAGWSDEDPTAYMRFGISPKGFHAMILSAQHSAVFIDAYAEGETGHYICYFKKDFHKDEPFACLTDELPENQKHLGTTSVSQEKWAGDCQFRTYALALACTGEYAQFHGGTVPSVMAAFTTAMTRINGIYERDLDLTMVMVPNNNALIFLNAASDPYTNNDGGAMLGQNQTTCDNIIGNANYDIGHVFSTGGGGVAFLNSSCISGSKAGGVTGLNSPTGDPFYVDYVAHEMGHQFGGRHTFNSNQGSCNGNQSNAAAVEPGSGTTIQAYAGICGSHNVQNNSDAYFHAFSLNEMGNHIAGAGGNCAVLTPNGNTAPTVTVPQASYNVPVGTPFVLTATATDPDAGNMPTYCWEQMNNGNATMPPTANNTTGPAFRSLSPVVSPSRYFPNLNAIVSNTNPTWEVLPNVTRFMDFRCTARDNNPGGGCTDEANVRLNFTASAGPFRVTEPNTAAVVWMSNFMENVTWNVANTHLAPVSAANVDIFLSVDGGFTYPYTLATNTPNDGSHTVQVPNVVTTQARVMVKGSGNVFFDISNQNFTIEIGNVPHFVLGAEPLSQTGCPGGSAVYQFDLLPLVGFNETVQLTATGLPAGAGADFQPAALVPPGTAAMTIAILGNVPPGVYPITVEATAASWSQAVTVELVVLAEIMNAVALESPADGATVLGNATLQWEAVPGAEFYEVEISESPDFVVLTVTGNPAENQFALTGLGIGSVYYWRTRAANACGPGPYSPVFAFQVVSLECTTYQSTDVPKNIPPNSGGVTVSTIQVSDDFTVGTVSLTTEISHTWVGDLLGTLAGPDGTPVLLFDRPGHPVVNDGCSGDDLFVGFSDNATSTAAAFENACGTVPPAIAGNYQPIAPLSAFNGKNSTGTWTFSVNDLFPTEDDGTLDAWELTLCRTILFPAAILLKNNTLTVPQGLSENVTGAFLETQGSPGQTHYILLSVPENGTLALQGNALGIGGIFSQNDLNDGLIVYAHDGSQTTADSFRFDVLNDANGWLHDQVFHMQILENNIAASISLAQGLACFGDNTAVISVSASGGTPPFSYSLNGGMAQDGQTFGNLGEGTYEVTVTDANGLTFTTNTVVVTAPPAIVAMAEVNGDSVYVHASGGTGALSYSLDGLVFQNEAAFPGLSNGVYTILVRDENDCTITLQAIVAVNTMVVFASQTQTIACFGGTEGAITVNVGGGAPPYQYSLNGVVFQNDPVFQNLPSGGYTFTVQDADGFLQTADLMIEQPAAIAATAAVSGYEITVTANGGTGVLQYSLDGGALQASPVFSPVASGNHSLLVRDENGCETALAVSVDVPAISIDLKIALLPACSNSNDGALIAVGEGGIPPYQYSLNGGPFQSDNNFTGLGPGIYSVTLMDSGGFMVASISQTIVAPAPIVADATVAGFDVTVTASGGTSPFSYQLDGGIFQTSNLFAGLANGAHTVVVRDANGCEAVIDFLINVPALMVVATVAQGVSCHAGADGAISINASGGIPPYQYSLDGVVFQDQNIFTGLAPGSYQPTVMDAFGQVLSPPQITLDDPEPLSSEGSAFGPVITVVAAGGTGAYNYSFDNQPFQSANQYEVVWNGTYEVVTIDENGCTDTLQVVVNKPEVVFFTIVHASCADSEDGSVSIEGVDGGYPPYLFALENGSFTSNLLYPNLGIGEYIFIVVDSTGYEWFAHPILIDAPPPILATVAIMDNNLTINANGGKGSLLYSIDGGVTFQPGPVFNNLPNGTYDIVVMDENGCTAAITATVNFTSTNEAGNGLVFEVAPNPGSGLFHLTVQGNGPDTKRISVFNTMGQVVYRFTAPGGNQLREVVELGHLPAGQYLLEVVSGEHWGVKKLVIQR